LVKRFGGVVSIVKRMEFLALLKAMELRYDARCCVDDAPRTDDENIDEYRRHLRVN
jgi:hypothetical protein